MASTADESTLLHKVFRTVKPVKRSLGVFKENMWRDEKEVEADVEHFVIEFPLKLVMECALQCEGLLAALDVFRNEFRDKVRWHICCTCFTRCCTLVQSVVAPLYTI